jgi:multidrug resistance protein MdtO
MKQATGAGGYLPHSVDRLARFLAAELSNYPGRINVVMRCLLTSALIIVLSMTLEVPFLSLSVLVVFFVTQSNVVLTRLIGALFVVGSSVAIGSAVLLLKFTFDYPLLRILIASILFFGSVYLLRVTKIGVVFFIIAIVVIYAQTFVDLTDNAEALIRSVLWLWVAVNYPIMLTLLVNTWLLPAEPRQQLKEEIHRQWQAIDAQLGYLSGKNQAPAPITLQASQKGMLSLQKLLKFAIMRDARYRDHEARQLACITTVSRLYHAALDLQDLPLTAMQGPGRQRELAQLREAGAALDFAVAADRPFLLDAGWEDADHAIALAPLAEMRRALSAYASREAHPPPAEAVRASEPMLAADAWTNPAYMRFSLKTLLAVLLCYGLYNAANWPGIHTIMLTCVIVSLPSLGASVQRAVLRVAGALIGSALALITVVFVFPHLDDIAQLLVVVLPVLAGGAWVAAGSERISYTGTQLVFTFSIELLDQFSPATDLTDIRDRTIGVLLGVAICLFIQMSFWREGESDTLRHKLSGLLRAMSQLLRPHRQTDAADATLTLEWERQQLQAWTQLADCETLLARVALEPNWEPSAQENLTQQAQTVLAQSRQIMLAGNRLQSHMLTQLNQLAPDVRDATFALQEQAAGAVEQYADTLAASAGVPPAAISMQLLRRRLAEMPEEPQARSALPRHSMLDLVDALLRLLPTLPAWGSSTTAPAIRLEADHGA